MACSASVAAQTADGDRPASPTKESSQSVSGAKPAEAPQRDFLAELEARDNKRAEKSEEPPVYMTALGFVSKLALVIGLAYLTILGLKRVSQMKPGVEGGKRCMRVVESLSLGANRQLHLVEACSRTFVIASTPGRISLVAELDPEEAKSVVRSETPAGFGEQLKMFMGVGTDGSQSAGSVAEALRDSGSFLRDKAADLGGLRRRLRSSDDE